MNTYELKCNLFCLFEFYFCSLTNILKKLQHLRIKFRLEDNYVSISYSNSADAVQAKIFKSV